MIRTLLILAISAALVAACTPVEEPVTKSFSDPEYQAIRSSSQPAAPPGTCWGKIPLPAEIETAKEEVLVKKAEINADGTIGAPAVYRIETRQKITNPGDAIWFEAPCAAVQTPQFIGSLQRALNTRGLYRGPVSGQMDDRTRAAILRYQRARGLNSGILALATARDLGLIEVARPKS